jgi:hypothetical protein
MWQRASCEINDLCVPHLRMGDAVVGLETITFSCLRVPDQKIRKDFGGQFGFVWLSVSEDVSVLKEDQ